MSAPILEVGDLAVRYGPIEALSGVTLALAPGERLAVVGPNGSGKSTFLKAIVGLVGLDGGRLTVHSHAPGHDRCVAYVPQRAAIDWSFPLSVADVVLMGRAHRIGWLRRPAAADRRAVRDALDALGIAELAGRRIGDLSGGQQQRVLIARALAQEARLVLMDEPLNHLDAASAETVLAVLDRLAAAGVTVVAAMHDLAVAAARFDRVLLLARRMVAVGPPDDVLTPDRLVAAYGGGLRIVDGPDGRLVLADLGGHTPTPAAPSMAPHGG